MNLTDMWSVGCIFGELLAGSVFFPGGSSESHRPRTFQISRISHSSEMRPFPSDCPLTHSIPSSCGSTRRNHQGLGHTNEVTDSPDEPRLSSTKVPSDQVRSFLKGRFSFSSLASHSYRLLARSLTSPFLCCSFSLALHPKQSHSYLAYSVSDLERD